MKRTDSWPPTTWLLVIGFWLFAGAILAAWCGGQ
jgi:hypothetical protein